MKTRTYLITIALGIFAFGPLLQAEEKQTSESAVLAEELLILLNGQKNVDAVFQQMGKIQDQSAISMGATPEAKERQQKMREAINAEVKTIINWDTIKPMFISIYSETFTPDELQGMIAFYKTTLGQKWLEKQPQVQLATMQRIQSIMAEAQPKMQEAIKRAMQVEMPKEQK